MTARHPILRSLFAVIIAGTLPFGCGGAKSVPETLPTALADAAPLLNSVTAAIPGITQTQAILGAGSIFELARAKMPAEQFSAVAGAVPGADALASEAVTKGLPANVTGMADVTKFLKKSGISPAQVGQLIPVIGNEVKAKVTPDIATAFMAAIS
jgi:hypothetical protein